MCLFTSSWHDQISWVQRKKPRMERSRLTPPQGLHLKFPHYTVVCISLAWRVTIRLLLSPGRVIDSINSKFLAINNSRELNISDFSWRPTHECICISVKVTIVSKYKLWSWEQNENEMYALSIYFPFKTQVQVKYLNYFILFYFVVNNFKFNEH